ncbi:MAG: hypothetical protein ACOVNZ_03695 [Crocinitomicaceae bacterium]
MEQSKCDFQFDFIELSLDHADYSASFLWILHADKIPPHIGISKEESFFSLKVNGKDENLPVEKLIALIQLKRIPTILIPLKHHLSIDEIALKYKQFDRAVNLKSTCLTPIKELLFPNEEIHRLKDLLEIICENGQLNCVFGLNLSSTYEGIPFYTTDEIQNRLEKLTHVKG